MNNEINPQYVEQCQQKLIELGFEPQGATLHAFLPGTGILIDFSAIDPAKYAQYSIRMCVQIAKEQGRGEVRDKLCSLLDME